MCAGERRAIPRVDAIAAPQSPFQALQRYGDGLWHGPAGFRAFLLRAVFARQCTDERRRRLPPSARQARQGRVSLICNQEGVAQTPAPIKRLWLIQVVALAAIDVRLIMGLHRAVTRSTG